jgi:FkbM family methyltransferase
MRALQPLVRAYTSWAAYLPRLRGRGLILRAVDGLQRRGFAPPIIVGEEGVRLELGTDYVARDIFYRRQWEPEETALLRSITPVGGTFLDVGANIGYFTLLASRWVGPSGTVFAFEPVSTTHARLQRNLALNPTSNVIAVKEGASSAPGTAAIALEDDAGHSHLFAGETNVGRQETITLTTVDAFVASKGLKRVDVIKIDTEGADFEVLRGAEATLRRFRPVVLMEVELIARFGATVDDVKLFLDGIGYDGEVLGHRSATDLLCRPRRATTGR